MASFNSTGVDEDQVLVEEKRSVRLLTLNRTKQLNALSFKMVSRLLELFVSYDTDPSVKLVVVKGKGRAFCAGGDVSAVVHDLKQGDWRKGAYFFQKEFILNYLMATFSKPQVSLLNGIVMGGGAGVSIHGRFRVATEKSVFAMPETALGLFPDKLKDLEEALCRADTSPPCNISEIIDKFTQRPILKERSAYHRTVEDILAALEEEALKKKDDWVTSTIQALKKASPTSLKISLRSIREGRLQGIGQCLIREYRMVCHVLRGEVSKDFVEGCRAILLDKDHNPKWEPSNLGLVTDAMVERYFSRIEDEDWEDLKLPARSNLPASAISKL
ncbi:3-hydroxyisobutyryl-CoA hydrolase 1 [Cucurbita argyrosperma subsp. argyrosperma]|nr:3-hydroxyisobutyryl-CoA hydrolase 1 [Cucurbita argyrosperma subsp. argyrosperma]